MMIKFQGDIKAIKGKTNFLKYTIKEIAKDHHYQIDQIEYAFINDEELLKINQDVLQHDYYTDIITFDYTEGKALNGEIYISLDRVLDNSKKYKEVFHVELSRVIFHGILHMVGYKDKSKKASEKMREMENKYIGKYLKMFPVEQ